MAKKKETDENTGLVRQFDDMKKKHPDAMLLSGRATSMRYTGRTR